MNSAQNGATSSEGSITRDDILRLIEDPTGGIQLVAQPIVDLRRAVVVGYETLSRFSIPGKKSFPDKVFAAANGAGLGAELEAIVVRKALQLSRQKPSNCFVTINIDPLHVRAPAVEAAIAEHGSLAAVIFELTEHNTISDLEGMRKALDELRKRGAMIAIDDAGAGYSGLKQIIELQPQFLKIDRDLVTNVHLNEAKRALIQMMGQLAARLDAWVLAEGIETEAELNALAKLGVPLGQGYFLGRPAAPWVGVTEEAQSSLMKRASSPRLMIETPVIRVRERTIDDIIEPCSTCEDDSEWPTAAKIAVRVDSTMRPIGMRLSNEDGPRLRPAQELLRVKASASIADVALRASTRPERLRWDPIICIDDRGNFEGIVPMQRLVCALANEQVIEERAADSLSPASDGFARPATHH